MHEHTDVLFRLDGTRYEWKKKDDVDGGVRNKTKTRRGSSFANLFRRRRRGSTTNESDNIVPAKPDGLYP